MDPFVHSAEIALRLALATVFGGALGLEREWRGKAAGLRTHMMVCLGAATFTLIGFELYDATARMDDPSARLDPLRILEGVAGGLGFLGAGAILQRGANVHGLTTAGSLWLTGALGVAVGGGQYVIAGAAVALGLTTLYLVGRLEGPLHRARERGGEERAPPP